MKTGYVYLLTNQPFRTLYISVSSDLVKRIYEHKTKAVKGFTQEYNLDQLVYYEIHENIDQAILREKQIKEWKRNWKLRLIMDMNPQWRDLYDDIVR